MLSVGAYLSGCAAVVLVVGALAYGAWLVRRAFLPEWSGAIARLAEVVIAVAVLFAAGQLLGAFHWFSRGPVLVGELVAGALLIGVGRHFGGARGARDAAPPSGRARWPDRRECIAAGVAIGVVVVQWLTHVAYAYGKGMTHSDTLWYHQPFAARFVQHHSFNVLDGVGLEAGRLYPLNGPLLHALGILAFGRDILSPLFNFAWMLVALLAAWCIGRRWAVGHVCVAGSALALGLPMMTATQPGQASTDIGCAAMFLAAIALLLETRYEPAAVGVAGLALGLGLSMKLTIAAPAAVLAVGVAVLAWRAGRRLSVGCWLAGLAATGSFWFLRNWRLRGSPLPWYDLHLGPIHLPVYEPAAAANAGQPPVRVGITNADVWRNAYLPALWQALGRFWPLVVALLVGGIAVLVVRGKSPLHRLAGGAAAAGAVAWIFTPYTGGLNFVFGLRYLDPPLLVVLTLAPLCLPQSTRWRRVQLAVAAVFIAVSVTMPNRERIPAWPAGRWIPALAVALLAAAVVYVFVRSDRRRIVAGAAIAALVLAGYGVQRHYLEHRYVAVGLPNDALDEYFREVRHASVGVVGFDDTYPMFGLDLSNDVRRVDDPLFDLGADPCVTWRTRLTSFDYVVISRGNFGFYLIPDDSVFAGAPSAQLVLRDGPNEIYRLSGPLDPATCPSPAT